MMRRDHLTKFYSLTSNGMENNDIKQPLEAVTPNKD